MHAADIKERCPRAKHFWWLSVCLCVHAYVRWQSAEGGNQVVSRDPGGCVVQMGQWHAERKGYYPSHQKGSPDPAPCQKIFCFILFYFYFIFFISLRSSGMKEVEAEVLW